MKILSKIFKNISVYRALVLSFSLFLLTFFLVGCGTFELSSNWRDREITVDGKSDDWMGEMIYFEEENISVGLLNDESFMYICMIAENPFVLNRVMRQGLTIWFDPDGGKEKAFGIKFPIGMQGRQGQRAPQRTRGEERIRGEEQDQERLQRAFRRSMAELEILGPGKDEKKRIAVEEATGIDIYLEATSGLFVYELKVPLLHGEQQPYAVGAEAGSSVSIGLETPKIDRDAMRERMGGRSGMGGRGGMGGRSGMGGRGGMGMGGRGGMQMPKPLKIWAVVQLASGN